MMDARCVETTDVSEIKVEELGKKAIFLNKERLPHRRIKMDGCVKKNETAADFVVVKPDVGTVIIELKGKHVEHAAEQVNATARFLRGIDHQPAKLAGLIVASTYPKANGTVQKQQQKFYREFKGPLHVVTKNYQFDFEKILSAAGPL